MTQDTKQINLKSSLDRFIAIGIELNKEFYDNLKSSLDRFIVSLPCFSISVDVFKIQFG